MKIVQQTFPSILPVELSDIKNRLKVDGSVEDFIISAWVKSATSFIEQYTNRVLLQSTFIAYFDNYEDIEIVKYPITSITVKYYNSAGTLTTMTSGTDYVTDLKDCPTRVKFLNTPSIQSDIFNGLEVHFTAGHSDINTIDAGIIQALNVIVGSFYENRQNETTFAVNELPINFRVLLDLYVKGYYL